MEPGDREATIRRYRARLARDGFGPRALGWDKGRQSERFAAVLRGVGVEFTSLLDVGCGLGDLYAHLRERGFRGRYLGLDIVPEFIEEARRRFAGEGAEFRALDLSGEGLPQLPTAEVGVAIGIFNHRMRRSWKYLEAMFSAMWRHTSTVVALDFLSIAAEERRPELRYWDPGRVLRLGLSHSKRASLEHDYIPFEFMLKVWHDDSFSRDSPVFRQSPPGRGA